MEVDIKTVTAQWNTIVPSSFGVERVKRGKEEENERRERRREELVEGDGRAKTAGAQEGSLYWLTAFGYVMRLILSLLVHPLSSTPSAVPSTANLLLLVFCCFCHLPSSIWLPFLSASNALTRPSLRATQRTPTLTLPYWKLPSCYLPVHSSSTESLHSLWIA